MGGTSSSESAAIMSRLKRPLVLVTYRLALAGLLEISAMPMIIHRAVRDDARCAEKYGKDWDTYIRRVPYVFVPGVV